MCDWDSTARVGLLKVWNFNLSWYFLLFIKMLHKTEFFVLVLLSLKLLLEFFNEIYLFLLIWQIGFRFPRISYFQYAKDVLIVLVIKLKM